MQNLSSVKVHFELSVEFISSIVPACSGFIFCVVMDDHEVICGCDSSKHFSDLDYRIFLDWSEACLIAAPSALIVEQLTTSAVIPLS